MRFLRWFLTALIVFFVVGGGGFIMVREGLLFWAENRIESDVNYLQRTNTWAAVGERCLLETGTEAENLQLRFLNNHQYVLEVGCGSSQYFAWSEVEELPWMVKKTTGTAGFVVPITDRSVSGEITLELWNQHKLIHTDGEKLLIDWGKTDVVSDSLISSCQAHGLTCCDPVHEAGIGEGFSKAVNDCQDSCFSSCVRRPNLLFFQTDPATDATTREVHLSKANTFMLFNYTFESNEAPVKEVVLDFGDGTRETFNTASGKTTKEYTCDQDECHYTAHVSAVDERGIESPDLRISQIEIVIQ